MSGGLEDILTYSPMFLLGGTVALGVFSAHYSLSNFVEGVPRENRQRQKEIATELHLPELYGLEHEDLALVRVKKLYEVITDPDNNKNYNGVEGILPTLKRYLPGIKNQSRMFECDATKTGAFRYFLMDESTIEWLTDPAYTISDEEHRKKTSFFGEIVKFYTPVADFVVHKVLRMPDSQEKKLRYELIQ